MSNICTFRNRNRNASFQPICNASHTKQKYKLVNKCDGITMTKSNKLILSLGNVCCTNTHTHTLKHKIEDWENAFAGARFSVWASRILHSHKVGYIYLFMYVYMLVLICSCYSVLNSCVLNADMLEPENGAEVTQKRCIITNHVEITKIGLKWHERMKCAFAVKTKQ